MSTPDWILRLRSDPDAWTNYLEWLEEERKYVLEMNSKTWEEELIRQGQKKMLDNIKNKSIRDQKEAAQLERMRLQG